MGGDDALGGWRRSRAAISARAAACSGAGSIGMMIGTNSDVDGGPSMTKWFAVGKWMGEGVGGGGGGGEEGSGCQCRGGSRHRWRHGGGGRQG